jgi:hypothetical protein
MEYGKNTFRDRGVSFVVDGEGRVISIRGYSRHLERIEVKSSRPGNPLSEHTFDEAARCLGFKNAAELAQRLRDKGINVTETPKAARSMRSALGLAG